MSGGNAPAVHQGGDEQWAGLREFREGDSPRQVAWSVFARGGGLLVKTYESPVAHYRIFDLAQTVGGDLEARLEQVSTWIVAAHARRDIRVGEVLTNAAVIVPPLVKSGDEVRVSISTGAVEVTGIGRASGSGRAGDLIRVLMPSSRKGLKARITGPGSVEIVR